MVRLIQPFSRPEGDDGDDARDNRLEVIPQPCFQQEQQGKHDPEQAEPAAHG